MPARDKPGTGSAVAAAAALVLGPAFAADGPRAPAAATDAAQTIEVTGHYDNAVGSSDAASQSVVRAEMLKTRPLLRPGEVLETVPGLVVTQHSGDGKANQYFLRGFNLDHGTDFATTVDGLPVNMPTHAHGQGYSDLNFLIPELVQRIDYRKGPTFATNGDFSAAGSAAITYRTTLDAPFAQATLGEHGYRRLLGAGSSALLPTTTLLGAVEMMGNDGPWTLKEDLHRANALLTLAGGTAASGWSASLMAYDARWRSTDQVPLRLIAAGNYLGRPFGRFDAVDPTDNGRTTRSSLAARWHDSDATGTTQVSAYAMHYTLALYSDFTYFMERPATGDQFSQQEARNVYGLTASHSFAHELLGRTARSELGVQLRLGRIQVGLYDAVGGVVTEPARVDEVRETLAAIYGQTAIEWSAHLRSLVGLRADRLTARVDSRLQALNSGSAAQSLVSPKLALVLGPWAKTEFFVNAGGGFHSNDARGMTSAVDPKTGDPLGRVPALVRARGGELGLRTEALPGVQSSLALWRLDFDSELTYAGDSGTTEPNGPSRRYGLEWNNHWIARDWLLFDLDLAWTHARFRDVESDRITTGRYVPNAVDKVFTGTVTLKDLGPWSVSLTERYIGAGALTADNSVRSSPSLLSNLRVGRKLTPNSTLTLDVLNLFDRRYDDIQYDYATRLRGEAAPVNGKLVHPGEPRALRLTLQLRF